MASILQNSIIMGFKTVINSLTRDLKRMVWINMLFLSLIIPLALFGTSGETSKIALTFALGGFVLCGGNLFFINGYLVKKTESTLTSSYESFHHEHVYDELTKVYNRRCGLVRLNEEFSRARRSGNPLTFAMVDVDHFKTINDTYGHLVGDMVLTHVAATIKSGLRESDIVVRYGGEEFLVILPDTACCQATLPLDRLRTRLSQKPFLHNGIGIGASVSIGVADVADVDSGYLDTIHRADNALYRAKRSGRNRVVSDDRQQCLSNPGQ